MDWPFLCDNRSSMHHFYPSQVQGPMQDFRVRHCDPQLGDFHDGDFLWESGLHFCKHEDVDLLRSTQLSRLDEHCFPVHLSDRNRGIHWIRDLLCNHCESKDHQEEARQVDWQTTEVNRLGP